MKTRATASLRPLGMAIVLMVWAGPTVYLHSQPAAPASAYRIIRQDNVQADGSTGAFGFVSSSTSTPTPPGLPCTPIGVPADLLTQGGATFDQTIDGGAPVSPLPIDAGGALFSLYYADPSMPFKLLALTFVDPNVYCNIYCLQPNDLVDPNRTRTDLPYLVGYDMTGLPNGQQVPTVTSPTHTGPPFQTDFIRYAMRTRTGTDGSGNSVTNSINGTLPGSDGGYGYIFLANTYWAGSTSPPIGPPNVPQDYYYPFPTVGLSGLPKVTATQPSPPTASSGVSWAPASVQTSATSVLVGPKPAGVVTGWQETWSIYDGSGNLKASAPKGIYPFGLEQMTATLGPPGPVTNLTFPAGPIPLKGAPGTWPTLSFNISNLYPSRRVVVIVKQTSAPAASYVARVGTGIYADGVAGVSMPAGGTSAWSPGVQGFTFDFSKKYNGYIGGLFNQSGTYVVQVWMAVPLLNLAAIDAAYVSSPGTMLGFGSATFPDACLATGSTNGAGNWLLSGTPPHEWWWRELTNGGVSFNVDFGSGVTGDIITN
ncbi:MAG TPA: hypothetical protein VH639_28855 [Bryobacteraceae bacterium]